MPLPQALCGCWDTHFAHAHIEHSVHSIADAHRHIITRTQTELRTCSLIHNHAPPPPCDSSNTRAHTYTHTEAHTQATPTTPGWWTTSAYPSLRPCPWRGCWLPPGCTATMSTCLPLCQPLLKCVVTIRLFFLHGPLPSHQPGTSSSSLLTDLIKWRGVIFQGCLSCPHGSGQDLTWWVLLFYCENVIDYLVLVGLGPPRLWDICPSCPPSWLCPDVHAFPLLYLLSPVIS